MENNNDKSVLATIEDKFEDVFPAEQKIASFILDNPEKAVNANVSELANFSDVSDATVIRFCKHLGYEGYYQLRINLSRDLGRKQIDDNSSESDSVNSIFNQFSSKIKEIGEIISEDKMRKAVELITSANLVHLAAVGNTSPLVMYMGFRLERLGIRCTYNSLPEYFLNHINLAQKDDLLFVISQSGTSKHIVQAMELAKKKGLKTVAVTGHKYSPVSRLADCLLLSSDEDQPFDYYKTYSHLCEMSVVDALLNLVTNKDKILETDADKPEIILSESKL
ncbi:RpiR family transcriptional regulator [Halanaerobium saccharolyticum]|uniref:RpiR family transcriptional regulator n=1 Tax=Halanaerobium saccharolyticum TaxID=43595 RepID=A0A4R7Z9H8_9FIRM|nr:MurR/RpiR family transcriptional regulator [Halanaerobium saccharolyticum]RAK12573.1 RpiR family transcriptional regulator [Halanaerobium saccharolyticum]TDW06499.1 RpiR family transcriptional regulator [Halanaerobium saccharolyticum]TDX61747.1 RpiR family transcriptional regulator [Halanaerobium saccharolyticum]